MKIVGEAFRFTARYWAQNVPNNRDLGVVVYILLGGYAPFEEPDPQTLFHKIINADYEFDEEYWTCVSDDAKDFIRCLLTLNPRKRLTASQALEHRWMTVSDHVLAEQDLVAT
jgi:calcium/calmodulin-dependent protein kinase I